MVSDIVLTRPLPEKLRESVAAYVGCISGAMERSEYLEAVKAAGFINITVVDESPFPLEALANDPTALAIMEILEMTSESVLELASTILSIKIHGTRPD